MSSGVLVEPFRPLPPGAPKRRWWSSSERLEKGGWIESAKHSFRNVLATGYALSLTWRKVPGVGAMLGGLREEAAQSYASINGALASFDRATLRHLSTGDAHAEMKHQLRAWEDAGYRTIDWGFVRKPTADDIDVVQARLVSKDPKDASNGFVQVTLRIPSRQRLVALDARGRELARADDVPVVDHWVFERTLKPSAQARWRLVARLQPKEVEEHVTASDTAQHAHAHAAKVAPASEHPELLAKTQGGRGSKGKKARR